MRSLEIGNTYRADNTPHAEGPEAQAAETLNPKP